MEGSWIDRIGPCCSCGEWKLADVVIPLPYVAPIAGTGWSCVVCRRNSSGAIAICCSTCVQMGLPPLQAVQGKLPSVYRVPISQLMHTPMHDEVAHSWYDVWVAAGMKRCDPLIIVTGAASMWMLPNLKGGI